MTIYLCVCFASLPHICFLNGIMSEIVNRVASSALTTIDLADYYPEQAICIIDLKDWLFMGLILKEADFREKLGLYDWTQYQGAMTGIYCSIEAIIPIWAWMLIASRLEGIATEIISGDEEGVLRTYYRRRIEAMDPEEFRDQRLVFKGCGEKRIPEEAYMLLTRKLQPVAKSIMFGEPCSTVPVYKQKRA